MRKFKDVLIEDEGRDQGKVFRVTEMPASQAEKWAARALLAMAKSGVQIPDAAAKAGLAGLASVGMAAFSGITWELAEPLLDEMFRCVTKIEKAIPNGRPLVEEDVEEVGTRFKLRGVWAEVQFGFSFAAKLSTSGSAAAAEDPSSSTQTSQ